MITTRDIKVDLSRERRPLNQKTTKDVNVYVKKGTPKPSKIAVSTHNIEDVQDIAEKKRRDDIMAEKTAFQKNMAIYQDEQNELIAKEKKLGMKEKMAKVRAAKRKKK